MKKMFVIVGLFCLALMSHLHAQSVNNRNWKAYIADPINDTLVLHIHSDSSFVTNSKGEVIVKTNCTIVSDTLTLSDYGSGEHDCPDPGKYKIDLKDKSFTLTPVSDPCEGRAQALNGLKWTEVLKQP